MKKYCIICLVSFLLTSVSYAQKIDRQQVVSRNNPVVTSADPLNSLSVGNGHFATTVDVTGLQSYPLEYEQGVPLCAMSDWGWHSFPNVKGLRPQDTQKAMDLGHGHNEMYAVEYKKDGINKDATEYFRVNPHRLNLGNVALVLKNNDKRVALSELKDIHQRLDLYSGTVNSDFTALGSNVSVATACEPCNDAIISRIKSKLLSKGNAYVCITLPYPTGKHADAASDWSNADKHVSSIVSQKGKYAVIEHTIDTTIYYVLVSWEGNATLSQAAPHTYTLKTKGDALSFRVEYLQKKPSAASTFNFVKDLDTVSTFWKNWWNNGGIVDFDNCTDSRAKELERRVVLSQYLTYINCANSTPPQETGLTYNSWFGRPHLEMTWWHAVDFSLWDRPEVLESILDWYNDKAYVEAKRIAERQGFKGIRWMKMTDPWVGESPSNVGSFLTWQQPHYIYMAEEMWRRACDSVSCDASDEVSLAQKSVLAKYGDKVEETAEFLYDFARSCGQQNGMIRLYGQTAMQESMSKDFSYGHPFEQAYFVYGLMTAQKWRERMGKKRVAEWDQIVRHMAPLPEYSGIYTAGLPAQPFLDSDSLATGAEFDPFNYGGDTGKKQLSSEEFYLKCRSDHPAVLGACGLLPDYGLYDRARMQRTLDWVMQNWNWATTWGWDYGMTAMCAARLGDGDNAVNALLIDKGKNTYLVSGHNYQEPKRLRLYLPGNGALLDAVAMMCAGWDGCPDVSNPGFPQNGKWDVRWEGLHRMQ